MERFATDEAVRFGFHIGISLGAMILVVASCAGNTRNLSSSQEASASGLDSDADAANEAGTEADLCANSEPARARSFSWDRVAFPGYSIRKIYGSAPEHVFFAGQEIWHFNGQDFSKQAGWLENNIADLWVGSKNSAHAADEWGAMLVFDGESWRSSHSVNRISCDYGIWGTAPDSVFALCRDSFARYDGQRWQPITFVHPTEQSRIGGMNTKMWGTGSEELYAVAHNWIARWDGRLWNLITDAGGTSYDDIWGFASNDIFVVGARGSVIRFDGEQWTEQETGTEAHLKAVWGNAPDNVFAVGTGGTLLHFDGCDWAEIETGITENLVSIWGPGSGQGIFVGGENGALLRSRAPDQPPQTTDAPSFSGDEGRFVVGSHPTRGEIWRREFEGLTEWELEESQKRLLWVLNSVGETGVRWELQVIDAQTGETKASHRFRDPVIPSGFEFDWLGISNYRPHLFDLGERYALIARVSEFSEEREVSQWELSTVDLENNRVVYRRTAGALPGAIVGDGRHEYSAEEATVRTGEMGIRLVSRDIPTGRVRWRTAVWPYTPGIISFDNDIRLFYSPLAVLEFEGSTLHSCTADGVYRAVNSRNGRLIHSSGAGICRGFEFRDGEPVAETPNGLIRLSADQPLEQVTINGRIESVNGPRPMRVAVGDQVVRPGFDGVFRVTTQARGHILVMPLIRPDELHTVVIHAVVIPASGEQTAEVMAEWCGGFCD